MNKKGGVGFTALIVAILILVPTVAFAINWFNEEIENIKTNSPELFEKRDLLEGAIATEERVEVRIKMANIFDIARKLKKELAIENPEYKDKIRIWWLYKQLDNELSPENEKNGDIQGLLSALELSKEIEELTSGRL